MATLLQIDSSGQNEASITRRLSAFFAHKWKEANPEGRVIYRNLLETEIPYATEALIIAMNTPPETLSEKQKQLLAQPDVLMNEIQAADTYVFGVPMYNFSVPAIFKTYIDAIVRPGLTFSFAGGAPQGLLKNKKAIVITASGGDYSQEPMKNMDFVEPFIRVIFSFMGITEVTFIKAHGNDPATKASSEALAKSNIELLFQPAAIA